MISRLIEADIAKHFFKGKAILVFGPRQCGKTTMVRTIVKNAGLPFMWLNGDDADVRISLQSASSTRLQALIGNYKIVVIDEAQRIEDIGLVIKLIVDNISGVQVIATGSSAFELANKLNEPLTGRKFEYKLFPLSFGEMVQHSHLLEERRLLDHRLIYGSYPEIITKHGEEERNLRLLADSYLYKDLLSLEQVKKPALLSKLLQAFALQLGSEVSYNEVAQLVGADKETVERYVDLLEKAYVIFTLPAFSRNVRNEIKRGRKIYFYDTGIRNVVIKNFQPLALRQDKGALWENYLVAERWKRNEYRQHYPGTYFWRTHAQQEIDYIEEYNGTLSTFEFKWTAHTRQKMPKVFVDSYPNHTIEWINKDNYDDFLL